MFAKGLLDFLRVFDRDNHVTIQPPLDTQHFHTCRRQHLPLHVSCKHFYFTFANLHSSPWLIVESIAVIFRMLFPASLSCPDLRSIYQPAQDVWGRVHIRNLYILFFNTPSTIFKMQACRLSHAPLVLCGKSE